MNSSPIDLALLLGVGRRPRAASRKRSLGVDVRRAATLEVVAERLDDLLGLVLAHQAVVDEHAGELVADRPVDEQRGDRGVDAAGEPADHPAVADLGADRARPAPR